MGPISPRMRLVGSETRSHVCLPAGTAHKASRLPALATGGQHGSYCLRRAHGHAGEIGMLMAPCTDPCSPPRVGAGGHLAPHRSQQLSQHRRSRASPIHACILAGGQPPGPWAPPSGEQFAARRCESGKEQGTQAPGLAHRSGGSRPSVEASVRARHSLGFDCTAVEPAFTTTSAAMQ